jgi:flagellar biogenesis protein FliO
MNRNQAVGVLALLVIMLTPLCADAQTRASSEPKQWLRNDSHPQLSASSLSNRSAVGKVAAVSLLLALGGYAVWRKTKRVHAGVSPTKTHIRVVGGTLVGPKARAVVAEVGGRFILLGVTENSVRKLAWLDSVDDDDVETEREQEASDSPVTANNPTTHRLRSTPRIETMRRSHLHRSKFAEVLRDAVGIKSRSASNSALVLAQHTRDRVNLTVAKAQPLDELSLIDIEGQAAGLVSRLDRSK